MAHLKNLIYYNFSYKCARCSGACTAMMATGPATARESLCTDDDSKRALPALSEFSCARCGGDAEACPLRCLSAGCMAVVCTECALSASSVYARCPVCGKRTSGAGKRQVARDDKLGRALRGAFPGDYGERIEVGEREAAGRRLAEALSAVARSAAHPDLKRLVGNRSYAENARLLLLATLQTAETEEQAASLEAGATALETEARVGRARYAALARLLSSHVCDCASPHLCLPKRSRKAIDYVSCPAFDLDAKALTGESATGCRFWRRV